jgi:SP family facilitated glucose transporter-like MFS transporter 8
MGFSEMFCILGWLAIYLSKVSLVFFYISLCISHQLYFFKKYLKFTMWFLSIKVAIWLDVGRFLVGYGMGVFSFVVKSINSS